MIDWFEIPTKDLARAKSFYEEVFQVELRHADLANDLRMEMFPGGGMTGNGALCHHPRFYFPGAQGPLIYLNADPDLQAVLDRITPAGGEVLVPKTLISPQLGHMAVFRDSEGNRIALHSRT